jgi:hypothetical protein
MADAIALLREELSSIDALVGGGPEDADFFALLLRRDRVASKIKKAARAGSSSSRLSQPAAGGPVDGPEDAARLLASTARLVSRGASTLRSSALTPSAVSGPTQPPFLARVNHVAVVHGERVEGCVRLVGGLDGVTTAVALSRDAGPDALLFACSPPLPASFARAPSLIASSQPSGPALLAILSPDGLAVVLLPEHCLEGAGAPAPLPALIVAPELLAIARPVDAKWHPLSSRHLCVLCWDALRTFAVDVDGSGSLVATVVDEAPLSPGDAPPSAFAFGAARGWELLSVFIAGGDGSVAALCPFLPPGALLPSSDWAALLADADAAAAAEFSVVAGPVAPGSASAALENAASARKTGEWLRGCFEDANKDAQYKWLRGGAAWRPAVQPCVWAGAGAGKPGPVTAGAAACDVAVLPPTSPRASQPSLLLLFLDGSLLGLLGSAPVRPAFEGSRHEGSTWLVVSAVSVGQLGHPLAQARAAVGAGGATFAGGSPGEGLQAGGSRETLHVPRLAGHWQAGRPGAAPVPLAVAVVGRHAAVDVTLAFALGLERLGDALGQTGSADLPAAVAAVRQAGVRVHELVSDGAEDILGFAVGRAGAPCWLEGTGRPPRAVATGAGSAWMEGAVPCTVRGTFLRLPLAASTALLLLALGEGGKDGESLAAFARAPALAALVEELQTSRPEPAPAPYASDPPVVGTLPEAAVDAWVGDVGCVEGDARALAAGHRAVSDRAATLHASIHPQLAALYECVEAGANRLGSTQVGIDARLARAGATAALLQSRVALASLSLQLASTAGLSPEEAAAHKELSALLTQGRSLEGRWKPASGGAGAGPEARRMAAVLAAQEVAADRARPTAAAHVALDNAEAVVEAARAKRAHASALLRAMLELTS